MLFKFVILTCWPCHINIKSISPVLLACLEVPLTSFDDLDRLEQKDKPVQSSHSIYICTKMY